MLSALAACGGNPNVAQSALPAISSANAAQNADPIAADARRTLSESKAVVQIDAAGITAGSWIADSGTHGGWTSSVSSQINTSKVSNPAPQTVYQTQRAGASLTYVVSHLTANATYSVRMHFAETFFTSSGQRRFGATINGSTVFSNLDLFQASGGENIAFVEQANAKADSSGNITIQLTATLNYVTLAGIEIDSSSSSQPAPAPTAPSSSGGYPIYSAYFTGNTPFHHTVAQLMSAGAVVESGTIATHYWNEGIANEQLVSSGSGTPLTLAAAGQPAYIFSCPAYGTCNASGMTVHFPSSAAAQKSSDHHLNSFDPVYLHGEVDGWGGDGNANQACNLFSGNPGHATCSWGGFYPFSGNGLATDYSSSNAGGYAFGIMLVSAGELLQGHINHALGIQQSCLDDGGVYPSTVGRASDAHCASASEPNAKYGQLVHLKSSVNIASLGYSKYCTIIVQALQTYGAYTADNNGGWGLSISFEDASNYGTTNPWLDTIFPSMVAGGDASGYGSNMRAGTCLQRIPASDIEIIQISTNLP